MNITLIYATNSGGTFICSEIISEILRKKGHTVTVINAKDAQPTDLDAPDFIILASPSWMYEGMDGHPHDEMMRYFDRCKGKTVPGKKFAVYGLGDSSYPNFCGAIKYLETFVNDLKGTLVVNSLRIDGFFFAEEKSRKMVEVWTENLSTKLS